MLVVCTRNGDLKVKPTETEQLLVSVNADHVGGQNGVGAGLSHQTILVAANSVALQDLCDQQARLSHLPDVPNVHNVHRVQVGQHEVDYEANGVLFVRVVLEGADQREHGFGQYVLWNGEFLEKRENRN